MDSGHESAILVLPSGYPTSQGNQSFPGKLLDTLISIFITAIITSLVFDRADPLSYVFRRGMPVDFPEVLIVDTAFLDGAPRDLP